LLSPLTAQVETYSKPNFFVDLSFLCLSHPQNHIWIYEYYTI